MGTLPSSHSNRVWRVGFEFGSWGSSRRGVRAVDRGQALGYARALWARAWARSLISQALTPSLSGSGDTLFSLSGKSRHLPPLCVGLSGNGWVRGGARAVAGLHPAGIPPTRPGSRSTSASPPTCGCVVGTRVGRSRRRRWCLCRELRGGRVGWLCASRDERRAQRARGATSPRRGVGACDGVTRRRRGRAGSAALSTGATRFPRLRGIARSR